MATGFKTAEIQSGQVPSSQSNMPLYVDLSRLGITTLAEAQSVRVYADEAKTIELAREIVSETEMHVKVTTVDVGESIYVDWDGVRSDYATSATYGAENVWSDYAGVWHLSDTSTTFKDSTGTNDGTGVGTLPNTTAAQIGNGQDFNGSSDEIAVTNDTSWQLGTGDFTVQFWFKTNSTVTKYPVTMADGLSIGDDGLLMGIPSGVSSPIRTILRDGSAQNLVTGSTQANDNVWHNYTARRIGTTVEQFLDATSEGTVSSSKNITIATPLYLGASNGGNFYDGLMDEVRIVKGTGLSANWITTEYNNQNDEATFWGTWTTVSTSSTTKAIPVNAAKVAATLADYPAYVKPSAMTGWGALTLAEAQSLRFYSDSGLTTELAREVVSADEIWVKVPSLTTTTTIYADYDGVRSDYATSATYGAQNVWTGYEFVSHDGGGDR